MCFADAGTAQKGTRGFQSPLPAGGKMRSCSTRSGYRDRESNQVAKGPTGKPASISTFSGDLAQWIELVGCLQLRRTRGTAGTDQPITACRTPRGVMPVRARRSPRSRSPSATSRSRAFTRTLSAHLPARVPLVAEGDHLSWHRAGCLLAVTRLDVGAVPLSDGEMSR